MKFLVLALCMSAASAASFGVRPFPQEAKALVQVNVPEVVTFAPYVAYEANKNVVAGPVATAKAVRVVPVATAKAVGVVPVATAKAVYSAAQDVYNTGKDLYRNKENDAQIINYNSDVSADKFYYGYETSNGIAAEANSVAKNVGNTVAQAVEGSYRYVDPNGYTVEVKYVADENGYQPQSEVLPTSPPIPDYIVRSLEWIRTHYKEQEN